jgi:hypothetical protein
MLYRWIEILPDINKHSYIKLPGLFKTRLSHDSIPLKFFNPPSLHWHAASHQQTLSHNVVSSTPRLSKIRTHNFSGDRHLLHR